MRCPFGRLWYVGRNAVSNAIGYAKFYSSSPDTVIRVYDQAARKVAVAGSHPYRFYIHNPTSF